MLDAVRPMVDIQIRLAETAGMALLDVEHRLNCGISERRKNVVRQEIFPAVHTETESAARWVNGCQGWIVAAWQRGARHEAIR